MTEPADIAALRESIADAITSHPGNRSGNYDQRHVVSLYLADAVLPVVEAAYEPLLDEVERLRAKLALPCGSCHPCENWADETWRREGKKPPAVITWQDTRADLSAAQTSLTATQTVLDRVRELADELETCARDWARITGGPLNVATTGYRDSAQRLTAIVGRANDALGDTE